MFNEFEYNKSLKFQLDQKYREHANFLSSFGQSKSAIIKIIGHKVFGHYLGVLGVFSEIDSEVSVNVKMRLAGDFIHMHLNRLFNNQQRNHELVIYYMLQKYYVSAMARRSKKLTTVSTNLNALGPDKVEEVFLKKASNG